MSRFTNQIKSFNKMYGLVVADVPSFPFTGPEIKEQLKTRLRAFKAILVEEIDEVEDLIYDIDAAVPPTEVLANLADWLGDIQVYCASEMAKFGLDNDMVLDVIMASNESKLGADGKPIYDERGKVMKGPNYWRPEGQLQRYIQAAIMQAEKEGKE